MLFSSTTRKDLFRVFAVSGAVTALYHLTAVIYKTGETPVWRHLLFVVISLFCVYGVLKRPLYFTWFFAVLLVQQYYSHGLYLLKLWHEQQKIHWISVAVLTMLPIELLCLVEDYRIRKRP